MHKDPATPVLETYPNDELMFRLLDGAHEEQHTFNLTGLSWQKEPADRNSPIISSQTIGISEAFNLHITESYEPGDYLYYYGGIDDAWLGLWGILRVHDRYHGLFGAVIVESPGAVWYQNLTMKKGIYAEQAVITAPGIETFREYVLFIQNGIRLLDKEGNLIKTAVGEEGEDVDAEYTGEKGYNYRSERFANRLEKDSRIWKVFSSKVHGDPATPVLKSCAGDRVIFRTLMPADKPRNVGFAIHGHMWKEQRRDSFSRVIPLQGAISIGNTFDMELENGASCPGDYLYRSGSLKWDVESGMWGIFRVKKRKWSKRCVNACRKALGCICKK